MKLNKSKLIETLRQLNNDKTPYHVRKISGISVRRVYQIKNIYELTGEIPEIRKAGRPTKMIEQWEINIVKKAYEKYRVSADTLERIIRRDYDKNLAHNRIHKILIDLGFAKPRGIKDVRKKKWIRYERKHSLTAVHIDWHYFKGKWAFGVEDDASRKLLALIESKEETTDKSIEGMDKALEHGPIKQCISDHGSQFTSNFIDANSRFVEYLKSKGIQQILCRVKHPQSNGKIERWFGCYDKHREAFKSVEDFLYWYNDIRPHRSLRFDMLETPSQAFIRKLKR